jgi:hypothetical protein
MPKSITKKSTNILTLPSPPDYQPSSLSNLIFANPQSLFFRDGEVVIFRRPSSPLWQCRFKRQDGTWERVSTKQASIERAVQVACELYDEVRFRQRLGLAQNSIIELLILAVRFRQLTIALVGEDVRPCVNRYVG